MNPTRILRLQPGAPDQAQWILVDRDGAVEQQGECALDQVAGNGRDLVVLVPSEEVLLASVNVPTQSRQKLIQAIPFALEDQLTSDIEDLHFVPGTRQPDGSCPVAVVEHTRMRAWLDALNDAGLAPTRMVPDVLALPRQGENWTGVIDGQRVLVRTGASTGFAGEAENLAILLDAALEETGDAPPGHIIIDGAEETPELAHDVTFSAGQRDAARALAAGVAAGGLAPAELRTGAYTSSSDRRAWLRPWIPAAALLLTWIVLDTGQLLSERWQLQQELDTLDTRVEELFFDVFPDANRLTAPRQRMESQLNRLRGGDRPAGDDLLDTLLLVGPYLEGEDDFRLTGLSWRGDSLELELRASSLQRLDALQQTLDDEDALAAEIRQARSEDDEVHGRLLVRRQPS